MSTQKCYVKTLINNNKTHASYTIYKNLFPAFLLPKSLYYNIL